MKSINLNRETKRRYLNKSAAVMMAAAVSIGVFSQGAALNSSASEKSDNRTAGVVLSIREVSAIVAKGGTITEDGELTLSEAPEDTVLYPEWENKLLPKVSDYLSVREGASTESEVVGKLYKGDVAEITETLDGWYKITSGDVTGYVNSDYAAVGDDAYLLAEQDCVKKAVSKTAGLRVRESADLSAEIILTLDEGEKITVDKEAEEIEGWVAVITKSDKKGYVSAEFVDVETVYGEGITILEENLIALQKQIEKEEAERKAAAKASSSSVTRTSGGTETTQGSAVESSYDDVTLLAALIQLEAGPSDYEGDLAVGAVVVNRVKSGSYPNSVSGVIYQKGQFPPSKRIPSVIAKGVSSTCIAAAQAALSGADNTGGCLGFNSLSSGRSGTIIGDNVFF